MSDKTLAPQGNDDGTLRLHIERLCAAAEALLRTHPQGMTELEMIKQLQSSPWSLLEKANFSEPAALFPVHFLLFHALYRLRDDLAAHGEWLSIRPLDIHISFQAPGQPSFKDPGRYDQLRAFYLDLTNYRLPRSTLDRMLDNFWRGVQRPTDQELDEALGLLELECLPPHFSAVKKQFRRLAMRHHPDRGGNNQRLQQLNQAIAVVRQHYDAQFVA